MKNPYQKILIQRADRLGDVVLILPVIDALRSAYPDAEIHVLTSKIGAQFLDGHPDVTNIIADSSEEGVFSAGYKLLIQEIKVEKYTLYISLWNDRKYALLGFLAHIPKRLGDATDLTLALFYTQPIRQNWKDITRHQIEFNLDLLRPIGIKSSLKNGHVHIDEIAAANIQKRIRKVVNGAKKIILIFTGTGGTNEPIPEKAVQDFIQLIHLKNEFQIILAGQHTKGSLFNASKDSRVLNLVGQTSIKELVALIDASHFYIGPDTGPTQIASFLQKPMLFFSSMKPNPPARWGSLSPYCVIIRKEYTCYHDKMDACTPKTCFSYVTGTTLFQSFYELINQKSLNESRVGQELKRFHLKHTLRTLLLTRSLDEYDACFSSIQNHRDDHLLIFPYYVHRWSLTTVLRLIKLVKKHNINVLQGPIPFWVRRLIQLYMGIVEVYTRPVFEPLGFLPEYNTDELLGLYQKQCQR